MTQEDEFDLRGVLASKLLCWHRLTEAEAQNLVMNFSRLLSSGIFNATENVRSVLYVKDDELAAARAEVEALRADAERYRELRSRLLAADFDYTSEGLQVLVFEMPKGFQASADCDWMVDAAIAKGKQL